MKITFKREKYVQKTKSRKFLRLIDNEKNFKNLLKEPTVKRTNKIDQIKLYNQTHIHSVKKSVLKSYYYYKTYKTKCTINRSSPGSSTAANG